MAPTERLVALSARPRGSRGGRAAPLSASFSGHQPKRSVPASSNLASLNGETKVRPTCENVWCVTSSSPAAPG